MIISLSLSFSRVKDVKGSTLFLKPSQLCLNLVLDFTWGLTASIVCFKLSIGGGECKATFNKQCQVYGLQANEGFVFDLMDNAKMWECSRHEQL